MFLQVVSVWPQWCALPRGACRSQHETGCCMAPCWQDAAALIKIWQVFKPEWRVASLLSCVFSYEWSRSSKRWFSLGMSCNEINFFLVQYIVSKLIRLSYSLLCLVPNCLVFPSSSVERWWRSFTKRINQSLLGLAQSYWRSIQSPIALEVSQVWVAKLFCVQAGLKPFMTMKTQQCHWDVDPSLCQEIGVTQLRW